MRNVSDRNCRENQNTHFCSVTFFFWNSCLFWGNVEKYGGTRQATDDNIIRRMRLACLITRIIDRHSDYVILIAFELQQCLRERACVTLSRHCPSCYCYEGSIFRYVPDTTASHSITKQSTWSALDLKAKRVYNYLASLCPSQTRPMSACVQADTIAGTKVTVDKSAGVSRTEGSTLRRRDDTSADVDIALNTCRSIIIKWPRLCSINNATQGLALQYRCVLIHRHSTSPPCIA
jgi:hypothetical protein